MVWRKNVNLKTSYDHNFAGSRRPCPILCEDIQTVRGQVLVKSGPKRFGFRGVNGGYEYPVFMRGAGGVQTVQYEPHKGSAA